MGNVVNVTNKSMTWSDFAESASL